MSVSPGAHCVISSPLSADHWLIAPSCLTCPGHTIFVLDRTLYSLLGKQYRDCAMPFRLCPIIAPLLFDRSLPDLHGAYLQALLAAARRLHVPVPSRKDHCPTINL